MRIKYIAAALVAVFFGGISLSAQTPEEIVRKMSEQLDRADAEGIVMDLNMKMPVVGSFTTHNLVRGDRMKSTVTGKGKRVIMWYDGTTNWVYDEQAGEITVSPQKQSDSQKDNSDMKAFESITNGYDLVRRKRLKPGISSARSQSPTRTRTIQPRWTLRCQRLPIFPFICV